MVAALFIQMNALRYEIYNNDSIHLGDIELREDGWVPLDHSNKIFAESDGFYSTAKSIVLSKGSPKEKNLLSSDFFLEEEEESDYDLSIDNEIVDLKETNMNNIDHNEAVDTAIVTETETKTRKPKSKKIEVSDMESHDLSPAPDHTETTAEASTEKSAKTPTLTCIVTGKSRQSTNQYLEEKASRLGASVDDVITHYICKDAMKMLNAGKSLSEVQEALGVTGVTVDTEILARGIQLNGKKKRSEA